MSIPRAGEAQEVGSGGGATAHALSGTLHTGALVDSQIPAAIARDAEIGHPHVDADIPASITRDSEHAADAHAQALTGPITRLRSGTDAGKPGSGNTEGDVWWATDTDKLYIWNGSSWQQIGGASKRTITRSSGRYNFSADWTDVQLDDAGASEQTQIGMVIPFACKLTAVSVRTYNARTGGSVTAQIFKNGVDAGATYDLVIDATNTQQNYTTFSPGLAFVAGDRVDCRITSVAFAPFTSINHIMVLQED